MRATRSVVVVTTLLTTLLVAPRAQAAGAPVMPLSQVTAGMRCTAGSVIRGTAVTTFDAQVLDVVAGSDGTTEPKILLSVSGPAVDDTGVGPGFSGSPVSCPDATGTPRVIGAIAESLGAYGGKTVLATPIESVLGTPVAPPSGAAAAARRHAALLATARPIATPLTVSGLGAPVARALVAAGRKAGRPVIAAPAGPVGTYAPPAIVPGSAVATSYATGDLRLGAIGTVAYTDGASIWAFGHPLDGVGRRALLLQDAYVFGVIGNPVQSAESATYKLAAPGHTIGTLTSDGANAVAGTLGAAPHTVPVRVYTHETGSGARRAFAVDVADEYAAGPPLGFSVLSSVAPLAVAQAALETLGSVPGLLTARMCMRITLAGESKPLRFCNRYVSTTSIGEADGTFGNAVTDTAATDVQSALASVDDYTARLPVVQGVSITLSFTHGAQLALIRDVSLPASARAGSTVTARVRLQRLRGGTLVRRYKLRLPAGVRGERTVALRGVGADTGDPALGTDIVIDDSSSDEDTGDDGPGTVDALRSAVASTGRDDGVRVKVGSRTLDRRIEDPTLRIAGSGETTIRIRRR